MVAAGVVVVEAVVGAIVGGIVGAIVGIVTASRQAPQLLAQTFKMILFEHWSR